MMKRFEGVFARFNEDPPAILPDPMIQALQLPENAEVKALYDGLPKHDRYKTNGAAFAVMREIANDLSSMSKEAGAQVNLGLKIEEDAIRLTVEVESEHHSVIANMEKTIRRMVENHYGKFSDLSSGMAKA